MLSINEINEMTDEEVKAANKKLVRKLITRKVVMPLLITVAVSVAANILDKKLNGNEDEI